MNYDKLTVDDLKNLSAEDFDKMPEDILNNLIDQYMDTLPGFTFDLDIVMFDE